MAIALQLGSVRPLTALITSLACTLMAPAAHSLTLADTPLFLVSAGKANILVILDNSNSMDENASGAAVGSDSPDSKSEIARGVIKALIGTYSNKINMGLMTYKLNTPSAYYLHNSPYDVSYDPVNYNASYTGPRNSLTKRYRTPNPSSAGDFIHYNIALPFYASSNQGSAFCYSETAAFDNGTETYPGGPWDTYRCFTKKTGSSDALPIWGNSASELAKGYSALFYTGALSPTDSDLAQGILDFGRFLTWNYVSRTWFRNDSPGRGYLQTPIAFLDSTQASALTAKLACNIPGTPSPCTASGIQNAGLTPIEGTLYTAKDYFKGTWTDASEGYTPACYPLPESCGKNFVVLITDGLPSTDKSGTAVSDPATALASAAAAAAALNSEKIETYVVGFALPVGTDPATLNTIASSGGTHTAYSASDPTSLTTALDSIFVDILTKVSSASSVATNSTQLDTDTKIYQARFDSADWTGQLLAYPIKADGTLDALAWDAGTPSKMPVPSARNITVYKPGTGGVPFTWIGLSAAQQTALNGGDTLGASRVDYLRGSDALEVKNGGTLRNRSRALGDIVNSDPFFVGAESFGNDKLPGVEGNSYATYVTAKALNPKMVYVGANDGMLHGFDADTGVERMAHVPNAVFSDLKSLTSPSYTHHYFVDGSPKAADAYFSGAWHTVLVETLAGGGRAVTAVDVTDPTAHAGDKVLWEYTDTDLGYPLGEASVVRMADGEWAAVLGNGYLSDSHHAVLYIVNAQTGVLIRKIDTGVGGPGAAENGLATPTLVDMNGDRIADAAYAGDLQGNMWKFDLTGASPASWDVAYKTGATNRPLFITAAPDGTTQPITAKPAVGRHPSGGVVVLFGTGKYMELTDRIVPPSPQVQTFYGIHDEGSRITGGRSALKQQKVVIQTTAFGYDLRLTTQYQPGPSDHGWFIDLPTAGERQVSRPVLRGGRIIFTTLIPSTGTCSYGGSSWLMELDAISGARLKETPFDLNGDGLFNSLDWVTGTGDFDGSGTPKAVTVPVSGKKSKEGIIKTPAIIGAGEEEYKYASGTTGNVEITTEPGDGGAGRQSWRQLQ